MNRPALLAVLLLGVALAPAPARADRFSIGLNLGVPGISVGGFYGGHHVGIPFQVSIPFGYYSYPRVYPRTYVYQTPAPIVARPRAYVARPYDYYAYGYRPYSFYSYDYYPYGSFAYSYRPYSYYPYSYDSYTYYPYGYRYGYRYGDRYGDRHDDRGMDRRDDRRDHDLDYRDRDERRDDRDRDRIDHDDRNDRNDRIQRDNRENRRDIGRTERMNQTRTNRPIERPSLGRERFDSFRPQPRQVRPNVEMNRTPPHTEGGFIAERARTLSITRPSAPAGQSNRGNRSPDGRADRSTNAGSRSGGR